ncbi:MAG: DUF721 domain-containing protein [Alphaproteobacteria bacterium]|nr:DUF721 domain-containing protein [Alphaproteobacteria bacterium]
MAGDDRADKREHDKRFVYGPRALGAVVPAVVRPAFRRRAPATAQVLADWPAIVGPALAAVTVPRRLASGTLTIGCAGPVALELQHLAGALIERINSQLGRPTVTQLRFVQQSLPAPPAPAPPRPAAAPPRLQHLPEGPLREALERLGAAVLTGRTG